MPNIFIKERDYTSSGTPGSYSNIAVLITGYMGREAAQDDEIKPDSNGVYEFSSQQAFIDTIGDSVAIEKTMATVTERHYGYKMARELLGLGYPVIYRPIEKIADMKDAEFWSIFNDKASYDFRFISHGMLETNHDQAEHDKITNRIAEVEDDIEKLEQIINDAADDAAKASLYLKAIAPLGVEGDATTDGYTGTGEGYTGFKNDDGDRYQTFDEAYEVLSAKNTDDQYVAIAVLESLLDELNNGHVDPTVFNTINKNIADLASGTKGRGDCVALIELDEREYVKVGATERPEELIIKGINSMTITDGEYCAMTVPSVVYNINKEEVKLPGAFHYLACFMRSLSSGFAEWYAAAGYTRGVSNYSIHHTSVKLGEIAINALEPRYTVDDPQKTQPKFACNVIANFRGSYYLWGNRTAIALGAGEANDLTAKNFLNIRQLCSTIKKQLYVACRRFTFDPNSDTLWVNFVNAIRPTLDAMRADQGVRDYKIMKVYTDKKATLKAKIRIIPIEAVEDFDLEISLEDSFGETSAVVTE